MTKATLLRLSGLVAILAGTMRIGASFVITAPLNFNIEFSSFSIQVFQVQVFQGEFLYLSIDVLLLLGLIGFYASQYEKLGLPGLTGFVLAIIGIAIIRSNKMIPGVSLYPYGALIFLTGLNLLTISSSIAKQLPWWVTSSLLLSTLTGFAAFAFQGTNLPNIVSGILFGIGFIGIGIYLDLSAKNLQAKY
jgi:hypothetical protein